MQHDEHISEATHPVRLQSNRPPPGRRGPRRVLRTILVLLGVSATFAIAAGGGAVLHMGLPPARRLSAEAVNRMLASAFQGQLVIEQVGRFRLGGVDGVHGSMIDTEGRTVLVVDGLSARIRLRALVSSLLSRGDVKVLLSRVTVDHVEGILVPEEDGVPSVARAFVPRATESPSPQEPRVGRGVDVELGDVRLRHAWIHGRTGNLIVDAEIGDLWGSARIAPSGIHASLGHAALTARAPVPRESRADVWGRLSLPNDGEPSAEAHVRGVVGRVAAAADGLLDGKSVRIVADVPRTEAESVRDAFPGAPVYAPASAHVEVIGTLPHLEPRVHAVLGFGTIDVHGHVAVPGHAEFAIDARDIDLRTLSPSGPASRLAATSDIELSRKEDGTLRGRFDFSSPVGQLAGQRIPAARARGSFTEARVAAELRIDEPGMPLALDLTFYEKRGAAVVDFDARGDARDLTRVGRIGNAASGSARLRARGRVDISNKLVDARVGAEGAQLARGELAIDAASLDARVRGPFERPRVEGSVSLTRGNTSAKLRVQDAILGDGGVNVPSLVIEGLGEPMRMSARFAVGRVNASAAAPDVDLARVALLFGRKESSGHVSLVAQLDAHGNEAHGNVSLDLREADLGRLKGANAHVEAVLNVRRIAVHATASLEGTGDVKVDAPDVKLGGPAFDARAWRRATGAVSTEANVDLERALQLLPADGRPLDKLSGRLMLRGQAQRARAEDVPSLEISLATSELVAHGRTWQTEGLDVRATGTTRTGGGDAHFAVELVDRRGTFASLSFDSRLPVSDVRTAPVSAHLVLPRRALSEMPRIIGQIPLDGDVELALDLRGTASDPQVDMKARGWSLRASRDSRTRPYDADIAATYDGERGDVQARAFRGNDVLLDANAQMALAARDVLEPGRPVPWIASARAVLRSFPLESVTPIADRHVRGEMSGQLELRDLHKEAALDAHFEFNDLRVGGAFFPRTSVTLKSMRGLFDARARLDQTDGFGELSARLGLTWGAAVAPELDKNHPIDVTFTAHQLRAAAARPLLEGTFSELDGRVDANGSVHAMPSTTTGEVSGAVVISKGVFHIPTIGGQFPNARAKIVMHPWGTLRFDDVSADGVTGHLDAWGHAQFEGLSPARAEGHVRIPRDQKIPLSLEGVSFGEAWGTVDATTALSDGGKHVEAQVSIPVLHVDLPQSTAHPVQPLDADPHIQVGARRPDGRFVLLPLEPPEQKRPEGAARIRMAIRLGDNVVVRRDSALELVLTGSPVVEIAEAARVSGQIALARGKIEVQGKMFQIERGTVTFTGQDPSNPVVVATAYWDAPEGTRVYADFTGPLKTGKLALRSEPPHTQDEVLALLLFGSPEGSFGASSPTSDQGTAAKATGLGGAYVAQGINKALSGVTSVDVSTRVDTSQANNPRPELEVQVTKDVTVKAAYNLGVPGPGQNPDRTLLMIDWRFVRQWLLETTIGDRGSSMLDLLWRYRY